MLFVTLVQRLQTYENIEQTLRWVAYASLAMAGLGLLQYFSGTDRFAWVFVHPSRSASLDVTGPFANSNHFAHFVALGIGPIVWWLQSLDQTIAAGPTGNTFRGQKTNGLGFRVVAGAALLIVALAGLLAKSRGGMLVMGLATVFSVIMYIRMQRLSLKSLYVLAGLAICVLAALGLHGYDAVQTEIASFTQGSIDSIDRSAARRRVWAANLEAARQFPVLGTGVGSHAEIYQKYYEHFSTVEYTHAESSLLQILTEAGIAGFGLAGIALLCCLGWMLQTVFCSNDQIRSLAIAVAAGILVSMTHAVFDFPWHIPACMSLTIVLVAALCSLNMQVDQDATETVETTPSRTQFRGGSIPATVLGGFVLLLVAIHSYLGPARAASSWLKYKRLSRQTQRDTRSWLVSGDTPEEREKSINSVILDSSRRMADLLQDTLRFDPHHPRAHNRLAEVYLRMFEISQQSSSNAMGLTQIRNAAIASKFKSRRELDGWLERAIGEPRKLLDESLRHSFESSRVCPLIGSSYLHQADLAFLHGVDKEGSKLLIAAAAKVRPHDARVLFTVGREAALMGDVATSLKYWKRSFHLSHQYRDAIVNALARGMGAPLFIQHFEPDQAGLESLFRYYRNDNASDQARVVAPFVIRNLEQKAEALSGVPAAKMYHQCWDIYKYLGESDLALQYVHKASKSAPNWYEGRLSLADELLAQNRFEDALEEYRWCSRRRPFDGKIKRKLETVQTLISRGPQINLADQHGGLVIPDGPQRY